MRIMLISILITLTLLSGCTRLKDKRLALTDKTTHKMTAAPGQAETIQKRMALLIGNADYPGALKLKNPVNDIDLIKQSLQAIGFEVTAVNNIKNQTEWLEVLNQFGKRLDAGTLVVFYYAGHGFRYSTEQGDKDFLRPIDAEFITDSDIVYNAIEVKRVINKLADYQPAAMIAMIDACRENFKLGQNRGLYRGTGSLNRSLAQVAYKTNIPLLQLYSTDIQGVADDGEGRNSPFALALAKTLNVAGQSVYDALNQVLEMVPKMAKLSMNQMKQVPAIRQSGAFPKICLTNNCNRRLEAATPDSTIAASDDLEIRSESNFWHIGDLIEAENAQLSGHWKQWAAPNSSGGMLITNELDVFGEWANSSKLRLSFIGNGVNIIYRQDKWYGRIKVKIDGQVVGVLNQKGFYPGYQSAQKFTAGAFGKHQLEISEPDDVITLDAIQIF